MTEAQIDAAVKAMKECSVGGELYYESDFKNAAKAALTAAAENKPNQLCAKCAAEITHSEESGVTEQKPLVIVPELSEAQLRALKNEWDKPAEVSKLNSVCGVEYAQEVKEIEAATIERCAQVADEYGGWGPHIAAAIRALATEKK